MDITARFDYDRLDHTKDNTPHLVVSLRAPTLDWVKKRPQIAILPTIDLSGSMEGPKLEYAKQSCLKLVEHLQDGDFAGLVTFESQAKLEVKPQQVTAEFKEELKRAIRGLKVLGGTNFADGIVLALDTIQRLDLPPKFLHRIILFTDGMPTAGLTDNRAILKLLNKKRARATISSFGYGVGHDTWGGCDQDFLTEVASQGNGNYAYVQNPDDALGAFGKELGGLLSTFATDLRLEIEPVNGSLITTAVTNIKYEEDVLGLAEVEISDILGEETRHLVFETKVSQKDKVFPRETTAFDVRLSYDVLTEDGDKVTKKVEAKARLQLVKAKDAQDKPHQEVDEVVALHQTIRAQLQAEEEAKKGNFQQAAQVMQVMQVSAQGRGHQGIAAAAHQTQQVVGNGIMYQQGAGYLRSFAAGGTRAYGTSAMDGQAQQALTSCNVALSNSVMDQVSSNFTAEGTPEPDSFADKSGTFADSSVTFTSTED